MRDRGVVSMDHLQATQRGGGAEIAEIAGLDIAGPQNRCGFISI